MTSSNPVISRETVPLLDTDVLRTFVAIAECGSFTRAAKQVFRTPSALSMQIKRLEEILGHVLFVREARHVRLTPEGEVLLGYGRRLLRLNEEAMQQFLTPAYGPDHHRESGAGGAGRGGPYGTIGMGRP